MWGDVFNIFKLDVSFREMMCCASRNEETHNLGLEARLSICCGGAVMTVALIPEQCLIITADQKRQLSAWHSITGALRWKRISHEEVRSVFYLHSLRMIITGDEGKFITGWCPETGEIKLEIAANASLLTSVFAVPHLGRVVAAGAHGDVTVWNVETWQKVDSFQFEDHLLCAVDAEEIKSILSADGQHCTASVWNVETGAKMREFVCDDWVLSVAFSAVARGVITVDEEHWLTMWEVDTGYSLWRMKMQAVNVLACMSDLGVVICNDTDNLVFFDEFGSKLIELPSAGERRNRVKHAVSALMYDPQSMEVAVGDHSGVLTVWSLRDANSLEVLARPPTPRMTTVGLD